MTTARSITPTLLTGALLAGAALWCPPAEAARVQPIQDVENAPVPDGLDMATVGDAIIDGCAVRNWMAEEVAPGHMQCTLHLRTHMAKVDIRYDTSAYSITYADSDDLKYDAKDHEIHRNYNSWVQNLDGDIRNELLKASRRAD